MSNVASRGLNNGEIGAAVSVFDAIGKAAVSVVDNILDKYGKKNVLVGGFSLHWFAY